MYKLLKIYADESIWYVKLKINQKSSRLGFVKKNILLSITEPIKKMKLFNNIQDINYILNSKGKCIVIYENENLNIDIIKQLMPEEFI